MKGYITYAVVIGFLAAAVWAVTKLDAARGLSSVTVFEFLILLVLAVGLAVVTAAIIKVSCGGLDCHVPWTEAMGLTSATSLLNLLPVRAGLGFRGAYLVFRRNLSVVGFATITGVTSAASLAALGLLGGMAVVVSWWADDIPAGPAIAMGLVYTGMLVLGAAAVTVGPLILRFRFPTRIRRFVSQLAAAATILTSRPSFIGKLVALTLLAIILVAIRLQLIASLVDESRSLSSAILLATAGSISAFVSIVPGGLGVREAAIAGTFVATGGSLEAGVVVAAVDRFVVLFRDLAIGGGWLFSERRNISDIKLRGRSNAPSKN